MACRVSVSASGGRGTATPYTSRRSWRGLSTIIAILPCDGSHLAGERSQRGAGLFNEVGRLQETLDVHVRYA